MVVSHREPSISSNIRAIIEQLNLNPVERRRLIDRSRQGGARCRSYPDATDCCGASPKITIGVYGCEERDELTIPGAIKPAAPRRIVEIERPRPRPETRQRLAAQLIKEARLAERASESKLECRPIVSIGPTPMCRDESRAGPTATARLLPRGQQTTSSRQCAARVDLAIEDKDAPAAAASVGPSRKIGDPRGSKRPDAASGVRCATKKRPRTAEDTVEITRPPKDALDRVVPVAKEDLPQLESASLSHTAAHHRISVRPKNRRPPRRTTPPTSTSSVSPSIPPTIVEDTLDSLEQQQQQQQSTSNASSPTEPKAIGVTRKSSSRLSRNSDIFEELEAKLPRKPSATSLSPDSLDVTATSRSSTEMSEEQMTTAMATATTATTATATATATTTEIGKSVARRPSNRISKGSSDLFEELEAKLPHSRRSSSNRLSKSPDSLDSAPWFSKSTKGFDKYEEAEYEESSKPVIRRLLLNPISKSTDRVSKSSDSLEAIEPLASDDTIERRRSSFEFRARRNSKAMSKSSESFDVLEQQSDRASEETAVGQELQKRSSISDINLSRGRRLSKSISKSSESFERIDMSETKDTEAEVTLEDVSKGCCRRSSKRMSSESSDNLELDDKLENRRVRRTPKRIPSASVADAMSSDDREGDKRPTPTRKPSRLQKSSESSELGSTDTLDSEKRNKFSESTETLDSLEKDLEQEDRRDEEITDSVVDKREKSDSWSSRNIATTDSDQTSMADDTDDSKSLISTDKYYWRQSSEPAKENLGIHQLLAITIVTRMADNGNNQRSPVIYPKKKQQMSTSQPASPVAKQEDTKMLFDNLLVGKNDEDLQNMLNGNISEVSTDTKSFKEKLIMFEKLGK